MSNPSENQQMCNVCEDDQVLDDESALVEHIRTKHIPDDRDEIKQQYGRIYSREFADDTDTIADQNLGPSGDGSTDSSVEENEETADSAALDDDNAGEQKRGSFEVNASDDDGGGVASAESSPGRDRTGTDQPTGSDVSRNRRKSGRRSGTDSTRTSDGAQISGFLEQNSDRGKWFLLGVGGCGGNIIDSIILRAETLDEQQSDLANAWQRAISGTAVVNANTTELANTYYAREYRDKESSRLADRLELGPGVRDGSGNDEEVGEFQAKYTLNEAPSDGFAGDQLEAAVDEYRIDNAQAVMFIHSAVHGTGTGATPVLANKLNDISESMVPDELAEEFGEVADLVGRKKIYSVTVIPKYADGDVQEKKNGLVGLARLAQQVDAIIPFDNKNLLQAQQDVGVDIDIPEDIQANVYLKQNKILVSFLETFSFSSIPKESQEEQHSVYGEDFDAEDAYTPIASAMSRDIASIMAPAYGRVKLSDAPSRGKLEALVSTTLNSGTLVDCEPSTAWGGAFVVQAPQDDYDQVKEFCEEETGEGRSRLRDVLSDEAFLNFDRDDSIQTGIKHTTNSEIDDFRLWALLYNPQIPILEEWKDWAEGRKEWSDDIAERLTDKWTAIEDLVEYLGRENRPTPDT